MIEIIGTTYYQLNPTGLYAINQFGEVKHCLYRGKINYYVRENTIVLEPTRQQLARYADRLIKPTGEVKKVLELFAPNPVWYDISRLEHYADPYKREVVRNPKFNRYFISKLNFISLAD